MMAKSFTHPTKTVYQPSNRQRQAHPKSCTFYIRIFYLKYNYLKYENHIKST